MAVGFDTSATNVACNITAGGWSYGLCNENKMYYTLDEALHIPDNTNYELAKRALIDRINARIEAIQNISFKRVSTFFIGKTYIPIVSIHGPQEGIMNHWYKKREIFYGMEVLAFIPEVAPTPQSEATTEQYTNKLKQHLLHYYKEEACDWRLANSSFSTGRLRESPSIAFVLYMAFTLEPFASQLPAFPLQFSHSRAMFYAPQFPALPMHLPWTSHLG